MGKGFDKLKKQVGAEAVAEEEERAVSVVCSLFLGLPRGRVGLSHTPLSLNWYLCHPGLHRYGHVTKAQFKRVGGGVLTLPIGGARRDRLCAKFVEDEFTKCDRLAELWAGAHARPLFGST
jgi:beta-catenin-like protein 1